MNRLPQVRFVRINHPADSDARVGGSYADAEWVFHFIAAGRWSFQLQDRLYTVAPGSLVLLPPGLLHIVRPLSKGAREHHVVHFLLHGPVPELAEAPFVVAAPRDTQRLVESHFRTMLREHCEGRPSADLRLSALMTDLIALTLRCSGSAVQSEAAELSLWPRVEKAVQHLQTSFGKAELSVPELARRAGLSTSHFRRAFHALTGRSPRDALLQHRIEQAQAALLAGGLNCTQIAGRCGFASVHVFSKAFRRATGHSPLQWRRRAEGGSPSARISRGGGAG